MSTWWLLPVPILLVGLVAVALLARAANRALEQVGEEQQRAAELRSRLIGIRVGAAILAERRQELDRR